MMGMKYKISEKIKVFILSQKESCSSLSCRKLAALTSVKFKVPVSKSAVNKVIKQAGLSAPVGRRKGVKPLRSLEDSSDMAGGFFLAAAEVELCLVRQLSQGIFGQDVAPRKIRRIEVNLRTLLYMPLFDLTVDKLDSYDKLGLWKLAGGRVSSVALRKFIVQIQGRCKYSDIAKITNKLNFQVADYVHFGLIDGSVFYADPQFKSIWALKKMPKNLHITPYFTVGYIKNTIVESVQPVILLSHGKDMGQEFLCFISSCRGVDSKNISRAVIHSGEQELQKIAYIPPGPRYFIFGLFGSQQKRHKLRFKAQLKRATISPWVRAFELAQGREYFVCDGEIILSQHVVQQDVKLRAGLLKKRKKDRGGIVLVTNIPREIRSMEDIAGVYLKRWPEPEESFDDMAGSEDSGRTASRTSYVHNVKYHNYNNVNKLNEIFPYLLDNLNIYVQHRYFPAKYGGNSLSRMRREFYTLDGKITSEKGCFLLELFAPRTSPKPAYEQDLLYAARRVNESNASILDKRLIILPEKTV